jgi:5-methylcytosine-specific restriction endonuclease McrA
MISIRLKNFQNSPARLVDVTSIDQIYRACREKVGSVCNGLYRDETVREPLKAYSVGRSVFDNSLEPKCYFCESAGEAMGKLEVEHFRPKDEVHADDLDPNEEHSGYYWLANEWSNLLLACRGCNNHKGSRFPIEGVRVKHHQPVRYRTLNRVDSIIDCQALLEELHVVLNPEIDIPENHLTFDYLGQIEPLNDSMQGEETIEILKLYRDPLFRARTKILNEFKSDLKTWVDYHALGRTDDANLRLVFFEISKRIVSRKRVSMAYTLWGRFLNTNFEQIFVVDLPGNIQPILRQAYQDAVTFELALNII